MNSGEPISPGKGMRWPRRRKNAYVRPLFRLKKASTYFILIRMMGLSWFADRPLDRRVAAHPEYRVRARHRQAMAQEQVGTAAKSVEQSEP
jgi:hypothetical protein